MGAPKHLDSRHNINTMQIFTITLNPAFDIHCIADSLTLYRENLACITNRDAGGKGINIARALNACNIPSTAIVALGKENGAEFRNSLTLPNVAFQYLPVAGRIRENITIHTPDTPETRISFSGFSADGSLLDTIASLLEKETLRDSIITFTGRNPQGITTAAAKAFLSQLKAQGARIVIDSRSFTLEDLLDVKPWLIKPNEEEIAMYSGTPVSDCQSAASAARSLREQGIENVLISLGKSGAVLACQEGDYYANAPEINVMSTIGAGDSMIAGFCAAAMQDSSYINMLKQAIAWGSAACMTEGTMPPKPADIQALLPRIVCQKL